MVMTVRTKEGLQHRQQQPGNDNSYTQRVINIRPCFGQHVRLNESFRDKMILSLLVMVQNYSLVSLSLCLRVIIKSIYLCNLASV